MRRPLQPLVARKVLVPKPAQEIDAGDDVKKKSLIPLPQLLTSRRSEYLATLLAVEKHNARIAEKLQESNLANVRKEGRQQPTPTRYQSLNSIIYPPGLRR